MIFWSLIVAFSMGVSTSRPLLYTSLHLNEVVWQSEPTDIFIGSPALVQLPNGRLLSCGDRFGSGFSGQPRNVSVFVSDDGGETWEFAAWVLNQYWSNLFLVGSDVYMLGTSSDAENGHQGGDVHISKSSDGGMTWTGASIVPAGESWAYATGPTPTVEYEGRYFRGMERWVSPYKWGVDFQASAVSAAVDADLLDPSSWRETTPLPFNTSWLPFAVETPAFLEGNMVLSPDNKTLYNILRVQTAPEMGNYAIQLEYVAATDSWRFLRLLSFPGGHTKFTIRYDPMTKLYVSIVNPNTNQSYADQRNILALSTSPDLIHWTIVGTLLSDDTGFRPEDSIRYTGFHYVDYQFVGHDLIYAVRTAYRTPVSYHNSDRMTFKRITNWRSIATPNATHPATMTAVSGAGFTSTPLHLGALAFLDRSYTWITIPPLFSSGAWDFARINGGAPNGAKPNVTFTVGQTGFCYAAFAGGTSLRAFASQWDPIAPTIYLQYNDTNKSQLPIYRKICQQGETHTLPQDGWAGSTLLYPTE